MDTVLSSPTRIRFQPRSPNQNYGKHYVSLYSHRPKSSRPYHQTANSFFLDGQPHVVACPDVPFRKLPRLARLGCQALAVPYRTSGRYAICWLYQDEDCRRDRYWLRWNVSQSVLLPSTAPQGDSLRLSFRQQPYPEDSEEQTQPPRFHHSKRLGRSQIPMGPRYSANPLPRCLSSPRKLRTPQPCWYPQPVPGQAWHHPLSQPPRTLRPPSFSQNSNPPPSQKPIYYAHHCPLSYGSRSFWSQPDPQPGANKLLGPPR